jgi:hypothetical protein
MPVPGRKHLIWPVTYTGFILLLSSIPGKGTDPETTGASLTLLLSPSVQNLLHIPLFGGLAMSWQLTLPGWGLGQRAAAGWAAGVALATALADEWHQRFVPGRFASATDLILDGTGIALGLGLVLWLRHLRSRRERMG